MLKIYWNRMLMHCGENLKYYITSAVLLGAGAFLAILTAAYLPELTLKELSLYMDDFFLSFSESGADTGAIMLSCIQGNAILFICIFLFSGSVIGIPILGLLAVYRGYAFGFTVAYLFRFLGIKALIFMFVSVLPHLIITLPCILSLFSLSLRFSLRALKERADMKRMILGHFLLLCVLFLAMTAGSLIQSYIEPVLLQLTVGFFI